MKFATAFTFLAGIASFAVAAPAPHHGVREVVAQEASAPEAAQIVPRHNWTTPAASISVSPSPRPSSTATAFSTFPRASIFMST